MASASLGRPRKYSSEGAAVKIEVDQIAILGRADESGENAHALRLLAARHAPDQLVDDAVRPPIVIERPSVIARDANKPPPEIEALILEDTLV